MMRTRIWIIALVFSMGFSGCKNNPADRLINGYDDGSVPESSGVFVLYDEELRTGGGISLLPSGENQVITISDYSDPRRTIYHMRYYWSGQDVPSSGVAQHLFAGFTFPITIDLADVDSATPKDLSAAAYTSLKFFIRGTLSAETKVRIEGPDDGEGGITPAQVELDGATLTTNWQEITLSIPSAHFSSVKTFVTVTFQYVQPPRTTAPGNGGQIFMDDIRYVR